MVLMFFLSFCLFACSGERGTGDANEIIPTDVLWIGNPDANRPEPDVEPMPDLSGPETGADTSLDVQGQDAHADASDGCPQPEDVKGDADSGSEPLTDLIHDETSPPVPDLVKDQGFVDAGACGTCPSETPACVDGVCACTGSSCSAGKYCKGGACVPCNNDSHCGPECVSCNSTGQYCNQSGAKCIDCDENHPCAPGKKCVDGACIQCEELGLCGPDCLECSEKMPDCVEGKCVCNDESCGIAHVCENGGCVECTANDPAHCGGECQVCTGDAPHCKAGGCTFCNTPQECGPACQQCGGETPLCKTDGTDCAQCLGSEDCAQGFVCQQNACVPDCQAEGCQSDLNDSGEKCSEAFVVGRLDAQNGMHFDGDTYKDGNEDDLNYVFEHPECWDASYDNFYRLFLRDGESLNVVLEPNDDEFDAMLKIYTGTKCDDDDAGLFQKNDKYLIKCYNDASDGDAESFDYVATSEGWYTVVVDGRQTGDEDDFGEYSVDIKLTCTQANCCCP